VHCPTRHWNQAIEDATGTAGITFVPLFDVTVGHEACVCANGEPLWINGIRLDDLVESIHPNQFAHSATAEFFLGHYVDDDGRLPPVFRPRGPRPGDHRRERGRGTHALASTLR
jgi:hypothetical protein